MSSTASSKSTSSTGRIRNPELIKGVRRFGHVAAQRKQAKWKFAKKGDTRTEEQKKAALELKEQKLQKTKGKAMINCKYYTVDKKPIQLKSRKNNHKPTRLRNSIQPGSVLIILAGRFRGKRVVFLKQLQSGLLLVTGPYKINGVPLRRVNQAYVIGTSTKVDVSSIDVSKITDDYFSQKPADRRKKVKSTSGFLEIKGEKKELPKVKKEEQKRVDNALMSIIEKTENLKHYLNAKFSLTNGQKPHEMIF